MDTALPNPNENPLAMDGPSDLVEPVGPTSQSQGYEMEKQRDGFGKALWTHEERGPMLVEGGLDSYRW